MLHNKTSILLNILIYALAYYYVLMASINDGFSSFWIGVPYGLYLLFEIWYFVKKSKIAYLHTLVLLIAIFFVSTDRSRFQFLYPMVGVTYTLTEEVKYSYSDFYVNEIEIYTDAYRQQDAQKPLFKLPNGSVIKVERQVTSGHPDMSVSYIFQVKSENFGQLHDYISNNLAKIKKVLSDKHAEYVKEPKTEFYHGNSEQFYIGAYDLKKLVEASGYTYDEHRVENNFTYLSFYLLIFPFVELLFWLLVFLKYRIKA